MEGDLGLPPPCQDLAPVLHSTVPGSHVLTHIVLPRSGAEGPHVYIHIDIDAGVRLRGSTSNSIYIGGGGGNLRGTSQNTGPSPE